jgi:hypothetical protein
VVIHGFLGEVHETAFILPAKDSPRIKIIQGAAVKQSSIKGDIVTINYQITSSQTVVQIGTRLQVIIVNRNAAFNFWVPEWDGGTAIVRSPYPSRSAEVSSKETLALRGDLKMTQAEVDVIADDDVKSVTFNGKPVWVQETAYGSLKFQVATSKLEVSLPNLEDLDWVSPHALRFDF